MLRPPQSRYVREVTDPLAPPRFRLRTFGPPALLGAEDDTFLGTHGHHRRRLALLAVLAAAGERGRSRDQLLLLFWPDVTQSRARHSLDQLLYALRNSLGEAVFDGVNPVRLNEAMITSDVGTFNAALERGELEAAVEQYEGPFLDGFYVTDAPEFEQWMEAERSRLAGSNATALERLARGAEDANDHATAVHYWRRLTDTDPLSSRNAAGLVGALMNAGDNVGALQYANRHEALVAQELGMSVDPAVASLVAELRAKTQAEPPASVPPAPVMSASVPDVAPSSATDAAPAADIHGSPIARHIPLPARRHRWAPWVFGAIGAIALIATVLWLRPVASAGKETAAIPSIAVLPFAAVGGAPQDAALVDGLTEELIAVLARLGHLRVIARTSAFAFKNSDIGVRRIADSLGVTYVLEGSAQKAGSQLRVQVRLVDARDGSTRWSETYDRELRDIFLVQSDIAGAVARALDLQIGTRTLAAITRGSTSSVAAYELYLRGNDPSLLRSDSGARKGLEYFRQAIALDSGYAAAYAGFARMHMRIAAGDDAEMPRHERLALAEKAALRAVSLNDSLGEAHAALGLARGENYEIASAEEELKRAALLEPTNARFHEWLVQHYVLTARPAEALVEARRALELDPLSATSTAEVAHALLANDRCDEALAQLGKLKALRPPLLRARHIAAQCYARKQMWPAAITELQPTAVTGGPRTQALLGYMLARGGRTGEARKILAALLDRARRIKGGAFEVAIVHAGLRDNDQTFRWLEKAVDDRSLSFKWLVVVVEDLATDSRFEQIRRRLGFQKR